MNKPSWRPCCPNHGEPLEDTGFPLPEKGTGKCPVSGVDFEFTAETDEETIVNDKFGGTTKKVDWKVTGDEVGVKN